MVLRFSGLIVGAALVAAALPAPAQPSAADAGAQAFLKRCASCHGRTAAGNPGVYPPLSEVGRHAGSEAGRTYLAAVTATGLSGRIEVGGKAYQGYMPGLRAATRLEERAAILNWLIRHNRSKAPLFTPAELTRREAVLRTPAEVGRARPAK
ncbi:c-type cytochrome [Sphingopyxis sp.]|uniref:c-type cytochrome n=1 Tax=Sphingopyxis sp. TaxID=1908224 RepID=UPI003D6C97A6